MVQTIIKVQHYYKKSFYNKKEQNFYRLNALHKTSSNW